jgi:hypothetical protein
MTSRISVLFFLSLIIFLSIQEFPRLITIAGIVVVLVSFTWHRAVSYKFYREMNREIAVLDETRQHIEPQSVLFPVNCSDNWIQNHFHCYLGIDKPIVDMRMPQANPEMPLNWNFDEMPGVLLGNLNQEQSGANWVSGNDNLDPVPADYFFIWKASRMEAEPDVLELLEKISPYYSESYRSPDGNALLYRVNTGLKTTQ